MAEEIEEEDSAEEEATDLGAMIGEEDSADTQADAVVDLAVEEKEAEALEKDEALAGTEKAEVTLEEEALTDQEENFKLDLS